MKSQIPPSIHLERFRTQNKIWIWPFKSPSPNKSHQPKSRSKTVNQSRKRKLQWAIPQPWVTYWKLCIKEHLHWTTNLQEKGADRTVRHLRVPMEAIRFHRARHMSNSKKSRKKWRSKTNPARMKMEASGTLSQTTSKGHSVAKLSRRESFKELKRTKKSKPSRDRWE